MDVSVEFPVTTRLSFLNHANVAPISRRARDRLVEWAEDTSEYGDAHLDHWFDEIERTRESAARLLGASTAEVAFLKNTSEGLSLVAEGLPWQAGDNLVVAEGEFPANVYPWTRLHERGVQRRVAECRGTRIPIEEVARLIDKRTRLLSISFVQFASGFRSDLTALGELCRANDVDFCVDAIQGLGVFPIDVNAMHIDYLASNSQKWLLAPQGAAIFFIRRSKLEKIRPSSIGWKSVANPHSYSTHDATLAADAGRFECGSFIVPSIVALGGSLSLLEEVGITKICRQLKRITDYLVEGILSSGGTILCSRGADEWSGIVSFVVPNTDPAKVVQNCLDREVVISHRDGCLRASPHFYNSTQDIDRLIEVLRAR